MTKAAVQKKVIKKILIANRGEIAVRVMRTCKEMGIKTVAVYSEADKKSLHVMMADEAYCIGPAPSAESYLCIDKIIAVAKASGTDAIHPGYGFLSEKAVFSKACEEAGVIFMGPTPDAIAAMGDKVTARNHARKAGVPMVPGTMEPIKEYEELKKVAKEIGYPVLLKASAGGGGKGMRTVRSEADLKSSFEMAASEAKRSFGDDRVYVEKLVEGPRHVEAQIACDSHGNGIFLLERECSMQRRHQKVIEEAPCSYLKDEVRQKIAKAALSLAKEVGYRGVGTLEFLVDDAQNFYFLEMNTRLQVEHTVTEMITGLDLVRLQVLIAQGDVLPLKQEDIKPRGHAIESRVYAEDPENGFMPSPGVVHFFEPPEGHGIRHDTGTYQGATIPIFYDPMIAKLIVHAETRDLAIEKMIRALREYKIGGLKNNIGFLLSLLDCETFRTAKMHTQFIDQHPELTKSAHPDIPLEVVLGVAAYEMLTGKSLGQKTAVGEGTAANSSSMWWQSGSAETLARRI